jgi:hypothetical protein
VGQHGNLCTSAIAHGANFASEIAAVARLDGRIDSEIVVRFDEWWKELGKANQLIRAETTRF